MEPHPITRGPVPMFGSVSFFSCSFVALSPHRLDRVSRDGAFGQWRLGFRWSRRPHEQICDICDVPFTSDVFLATALLGPRSREQAED